MTLRKMIDFLKFIQTFIQVALTTRRAPKNVPFMRLGGCKRLSFQNRSNELVVKSEHFVQKFAILNVVALLIAIELHSISHHLFI